MASNISTMVLVVESQVGITPSQLQKESALSTIVHVVESQVGITPRYFPKRKLIPIPTIIRPWRTQTLRHIMIIIIMKNIYIALRLTFIIVCSNSFLFYANDSEAYNDHNNNEEYLYSLKTVIYIIICFNSCLLDSYEKKYKEFLFVQL